MDANGTSNAGDKKAPKADRKCSTVTTDVDSKQAKFGKQEAWTAIDRPNVVDDGVPIRVYAQYYGGAEQNLVDIRVQSDVASLTLSLTPTEARAFADRLQDAAMFAERGEK